MKIFYSVETQIDFMDPGKPMYTPGVEKIKSNLELLTQYAVRNGIPLIGGIDVHFGTKEYAHREVELDINGGPFPMHCKKGTKGVEKIPETYVPSVIHPHYLDEHVNRNILREGLDRKALLFEKQQYDIFTNPAIDIFYREFGISEAIVSGVLTDWCVKDKVLGAQKRGVQCYVVEDAIYAANVEEGDEERVISKMKKAGAEFVTTKHVLEGRI